LIASLVISGLLMLAMIVAAGWAVMRLPGDARVPLHAGSPEYSLWLSKRAGLSVWLAAGAVAFAALAWLTLGQVAANWATSMRVTLLPAVMLVALAAEVAAIISARTPVDAAEQPTVPPEAESPEAEPQTVPGADDSEALPAQCAPGDEAKPGQRARRREQDPRHQTPLWPSTGQREVTDNCAQPHK
jgi:hypothetical protein